MLHDTMRAIRRDARRRFPYKSAWRVGAMRARRAVDQALARIPERHWPSESVREQLYEERLPCPD